MIPNKFALDYKRYTKKKASFFYVLKSVSRDKILRAIFYGRLEESTTSKVLKRIFGNRRKSLLGKKGIEIGKLDNIQGGLCLVHSYNITINSRARIGEDFTIFKGATIGSIRSGKKNGTPQIGNHVTVCANAFVCGNIVIGDDVLIAANAFVNFDVPSNSVVIGNPGVVYQKENPSADYLLPK